MSTSFGKSCANVCSSPLASVNVMEIGPSCSRRLYDEIDNMFMTEGTSSCSDY